MHRSRYALDFFSARERFLAGADTPRDYLERCIATIEARERDVHAFVTLGNGLIQDRVEERPVAVVVGAVGMTMAVIFGRFVHL